MDIAQATLDRIGQPESELLEYKAVLPPAATIAQLVCAFANTKGGAIVLGVVEDGKGIVINGLSDEFRAVQITRKAIDLLSPTPSVNYDYVVHQRQATLRHRRPEVGRGSIARRQGLCPDRRPHDPQAISTDQTSHRPRHRTTLEGSCGGSQSLHRSTSEAARPLRERPTHPRRPRQAPISEGVERSDRQSRR